MTIPNLLTLSRIILIPLVLALLYVGRPVLGATVFLILSLFDAIDGYLARRLNQVTDFGKIMDPVADKVLVISVLIVLVAQGTAQALPVVLISAREIIIAGLRSGKAQAGHVFGANYYGKIKTILQVIAVLMLMLSMPYANFVLWAAAIASIFSGATYIGRN